MLRWAFSISVVSLAAFAFLVASVSSPPRSQPVQFSHKLHLEHLRDGSHRQSMVSTHKKAILKELDDEATVGQMMEMVEQGNCTLCHGDFDKNVQDMSKLHGCAECHRVLLEHDWEGRKDQTSCAGCHNTAVQSPQASIPNTKTCGTCHLPPLGSSPEEAKLVEFVEQARTISWARVCDYLPGDIVFSHERHVELGRVKCQECHGPIELAEYPLSLEVTLSMEDCISCHEVSGADNDCLACHK